MRPLPWFPAAIVLLGLAGFGCGSARDLSTADARIVGQCTECHGGVDNDTGAPPRDMNGRSDATLASVGAHTAHVEAGLLAAAFDCSTCHPKPATVKAPLHADGTVQITFDPLATASGTLVAAYDRTSRGCANTYCHGGFAGGNLRNAPAWNGGAAQGACGTCHGDPAAAIPALSRTHSYLAAGSTAATCNVCHPATVKADGTIDVAGRKHVDGALQVDPAAAHPAGWMTVSSGQFHGLAADRSCFRCHAADLPARVSAVYCNVCHTPLGTRMVEPPL